MLKTWMVLTSLCLLVFACGGRSGIAESGRPVQKKSSLSYSNSGESCDSAIVITGIANADEASQAEYDYISSLYGKRDQQWKLIEQTRIDEEKASCDMLGFKVVATSQERFLYFKAKRKAKVKKDDE